MRQITEVAFRMTAGLALALAPTCASEPSHPEGSATYTNARYGYTVAYPDTLDLHEYSPENVSIGRVGGEGLAAAVEIALEVGDAGTFDEFAVERARQSCAADGPDVSLQCTDVQARQEFATAEGIAGIEFLLRHVTTRPGSSEVIAEGGRGPFFAFDVSRRVPQARTAVLYIRAPAVLTPEEADAELIRSVAASLRLAPGAHSP